MAGLDPNKTYRVKELNRIDNSPLSFEGKTFTGKFLMSNGLEMPLYHKVDNDKRSDFSSRVLLLEAVE
jgi:alpha-galactosidase